MATSGTSNATATSDIRVIDTFLRMTGCAGRRMRYLTYFECAVTSFFLVGTYQFVRHPTEDRSVRLHGVLCLAIQCYLLLCVPFRLYHRSEFRAMAAVSRDVDIPAEYRSSIRLLTKYYAVTANLFVVVSALYAAAFDSVRAGDPFTFPFADVLPVRTKSLTVYACKYAVYSLPVYVAHVEVCFLNVTFVHSVGVVKRLYETFAELVDDAMTDGDERKFKRAIRRHQELLKYFENMKLVFAKPILLSISFCAIYFGMTTFFVIQAIQGFIDQVILAVCITSGMAGLISIIIYCIYASNMFDLHDNILHQLFDRRLYHGNDSLKKLILIMMTRLTSPLEFKVGYIFTVNLNLLVKIIKFSYTVLNVLLTSITKQNLA